MTHEQYISLDSKIKHYKYLEKKINVLNDTKAKSDYMQDFVFEFLDSDLVEKLENSADEIINEQISRVKKKIEEL